MTGTFSGSLSRSESSVASILLDFELLDELISELREKDESRKLHTSDSLFQQIKKATARIHSNAGDIDLGEFHPN